MHFSKLGANMIGSIPGCGSVAIDCCHGFVPAIAESFIDFGKRPRPDRWRAG